MKTTPAFKHYFYEVGSEKGVSSSQAKTEIWANPDSHHLQGKKEGPSIIVVAYLDSPNRISTGSCYLYIRLHLFSSVFLITKISFDTLQTWL